VNGSDSCSYSYCTLNRKNKTQSASSSEDVEGGNGNASKISSVTGWNAQNMRTTSICAFRTRHARSLAIVSAQALHPCDVVENETWKLDGIHRAHLLFHPFRPRTYLHPFHRTLQIWEARRYRASWYTVENVNVSGNETRSVYATENVSANVSMNARPFLLYHRHHAHCVCEEEANGTRVEDGLGGRRARL